MTKFEDNMDFYNFIQYGQVSTKHEASKRPLEAQDIMTKKVISLNENDSINLFEEIATLEKIRHLPVVNNENEVAGILTHKDFFNVLSGKNISVQMKIKDLMKKEVKTITKDETLMDVARLMYEKGYGCLPVVEEKKLVGIITANDFLKYFSHKDLSLNRDIE